MARVAQIHTPHADLEVVFHRYPGAVISAEEALAEVIAVLGLADGLGRVVRLYNGYEELWLFRDDSDPEGYWVTAVYYNADGELKAKRAFIRPT